MYFANQSVYDSVAEIFVIDEVNANKSLIIW